jgi:hypothetical protein
MSRELLGKVLDLSLSHLSRSAGALLLKTAGSPWCADGDRASLAPDRTSNRPRANQG